MLGRYILYEKIASGGMASVHIGRLLGPAGFARTVAIKCMHPQFAADPEFVSMFLDEARLAARIRHPNVVPTLDVAATGGELFLVMEFVQGESLSQLMRSTAARGERIPLDIVTGIMVGVLRGLHAAHEATSDRGEPLEIVHRDMSPQNILVGTDGVARVLDFGVAKAVGRQHQTTKDGTLKGKVCYMAPEQIHGIVSRAADVYAASVVLWEALAGRKLFTGENGMHVLTTVQRGCDTPPSRHAENLPGALDEVVMRGLQLDPASRFATAREMAQALEEAIAPATASRIGDWVEAAARDTIHDRTALVASVESNSAVAPPPSLPVPSTEPHVLPVALPREGGHETAFAALTQAAVPFASVQRAGGKKLIAGIAALGGAAILTLAGLSAQRAKSASAASATSVSPASSAAQPSTTDDPTGSPATPPPSSPTISTPSAAPSTVTPASAAPAQDHANVGTGVARQRPVTPVQHPAATAAPAKGCTILTKYDADGDAHFVKVCN
jgi:serine/threonine-protein kinase